MLAVLAHPRAAPLCVPPDAPSAPLSEVGSSGISSALACMCLYAVRRIWHQNQEQCGGTNNEPPFTRLPASWGHELTIHTPPYLCTCRHRHTSYTYMCAQIYKHTDTERDRETDTNSADMTNPDTDIDRNTYSHIPSTQEHIPTCRREGRTLSAHQHEEHHIPVTTQHRRDLGKDTPNHIHIWRAALERTSSRTRCRVHEVKCRATTTMKQLRATHSHTPTCMPTGTHRQRTHHHTRHKHAQGPPPEQTSTPTWKQTAHNADTTRDTPCTPFFASCCCVGVLPKRPFLVPFFFLRILPHNLILIQL